MDKWDHRFMKMAYTIADWSSCFRKGRSIGCVIVLDKRIMTTGYNGAPAGEKHYIFYKTDAELKKWKCWALLGL